jgi:hypothetical protein
MTPADIWAIAGLLAVVGTALLGLVTIYRVIEDL